MPRTLLDDIKDDAGVFLEDFGVDAIYESVKDGTSCITVIFERNFPIIDPETQVVLEEATVAYCRTEDVPNAEFKSTLTIEDVLYEIETRQLDEAGITLLRLQEQ